MKRRKFNFILIGFIVVVIGLWLYLFLPGLLATQLFPLPDQYVETIKNEAKATNLDPCLVAALIKTESNFHEDARSGAGAIGLSQMMPATSIGWAKVINIPNFSPNRLISEPNLAIKMGTTYLKSLVDRNGGSVENALMAYNGGQGAVASRSTIGYARKVLQTKDVYCATYLSLNEATAAQTPAAAPPQRQSLNQILILWLTGRSNP